MHRGLLFLLAIIFSLVNLQKWQEKNILDVVVSPRMRGAVYTKRVISKSRLFVAHATIHFLGRGEGCAPWRLHWLRADDVIPAVIDQGGADTPAAPRALARGGGCPPIYLLQVSSINVSQLDMETKTIDTAQVETIRKWRM